VPTYTVNFTLDAATLTAAEAAVSEWKATPGASLVAILGPPVASTTDGLPQDVPPSGDVGNALEKAEGVTVFLYRLEPESVTQGVGQVQLHLHGEGFDRLGSHIVFDGVELATAFVSDVELYCTIDAKVGGHAPGTFDVLVRQDGQQTKALPFTIAPA